MRPDKVEPVIFARRNRVRVQLVLVNHPVLKSQITAGRTAKRNWLDTLPSPLLLYRRTIYRRMT